MQNVFDIMVVGAGMMGSAAARHLGQTGLRVVLVGPGEPGEAKHHTGVFASHYDNARITRRLDRNVDWSRLSSASIARYGEIEALGQRTFFHPVGALMAGPEEGPGSAFIRATAEVARQDEIEFEELRDAQLKRLFPYFQFPDGVLALYERDTGGWINPRDHVAAQIGAAVKRGVTHHVAEVSKVEEAEDHVIATCSDGSTIAARKVMIACGAFSKAEGLLPVPPDFKVFARTVVYFELSEAQVKELSNMPSVVYMPPDLSCDPYVLPPVRYPDGKHYIKIGGDPQNIELEDTGAIKAWFRTDGHADVAALLREAMLKLMPDLRDVPTSTGSCVTSFTSSGKPLIHQQTDRFFALTGGCGAGAKCCDEIGRLAAELVTAGRIRSGQYTTCFGPTDA
ncbi:MAG: FAD-binding oxidoreductase [Pseudomonadota bacterium]